MEVKTKKMPCQVGGKNFNAKSVKKQYTGEIYETVKEAAKECGLTHSYLVQMLKGKRQNTSGMIYYNRQKTSFQRVKW